MRNGRFGADTPAGFATRMGLFYGALFLVAGTKLPYFPVWLDGRGLSTAEIATIVAAPLFVRIVVTPAIGVVADARGDRRQALVAFAWVALAAFLLLGLARGFWAILAVTVLLSVASTSIMPFAETIAMAGVRRHGLDYGRMRLWGSLSFIAASFLAGLAVGATGDGVVLWLLVGGAAATVAAAHLMPGGADSGEGGTGAAGAAGAAGGRPGPSLADALALVASARFGLFIAAVGAVQAAHAVFYTFGVLHWQGQGISSGWAGVLWSVGVVAEIGLFAFSRAVVGLVGPVALIGIGAGAGIVRWTVMALDPPLAVLLPLQALHGLTYGATHLGAVHWMSERVGAAQAGTAQSVYGAVTHGIAMGAAMIAAGWLYAGWKGGAYWGMTALALAGLAATLALHRLGAEPAAPDGPRSHVT